MDFLGNHSSGTIYFYMNFNSLNVIYRVCLDTGVSDEEFDLRLSSMYIHYIHMIFCFDVRVTNFINALYRYFLFENK